MLSAGSARTRVPRCDHPLPDKTNEKPSSALLAPASSARVLSVSRAAELPIARAFSEASTLAA
jgi:hypothetical protein